MQKGLKVRRTITLAMAMAPTLVLAGCRQDMHNQPRMFPQRGTPVFADGRSAREQLAGTVARNQGDYDNYFFTGKVNGEEGSTLPIQLTPALLQRGQERYNVYCALCHSRVGNGAGEIVERGYRPAGDFHMERLRSAPIGHFFNVMTNGYGAMPDYSAQVTPEDRWAIAAYIRALQLSQHATTADVKSGEQPKKLSAIAQEEGLPANFAAEWKMPAGTAAYGTPNNQDNGIPGQEIKAAPAAAVKPATAPAALTPATQR